MRPVDKSLYTKNKATYKPYGKAKLVLFEAIGSFCSYCERQGFHSALDVEHIKHVEKGKNNPKEVDWDNFLLSCTNCNSCKLTKEIIGILLPHKDNTYELFDYLESGYIKPHPSLSEEKKKQAVALINLLRLDRVQYRKGYNTTVYSGNDTLWADRKKVWEIAQLFLIKYQNGNCDIETIKYLALPNGFWSIWMRAFETFPEVQKELINSFKGTRIEFFQDILSPNL